jgi:hypothetical protein
VTIEKHENIMAVLEADNEIFERFSEMRIT